MPNPPSNPIRDLLQRALDRATGHDFTGSNLPDPVPHRRPIIGPWEPERITQCLVRAWTDGTPEQPGFEAGLVFVTRDDIALLDRFLPLGPPPPAGVDLRHIAGGVSVALFSGPPPASGFDAEPPHEGNTMPNDEIVAPIDVLRRAYMHGPTPPQSDDFAEHQTAAYLAYSADQRAWTNTLTPLEAEATMTVLGSIASHHRERAAAADDLADVIRRRFEETGVSPAKRGGVVNAEEIRQSDNAAGHTGPASFRR